MYIQENKKSKFYLNIQKCYASSFNLNFPPVLYISSWFSSGAILQTKL